MSAMRHIDLRQITVLSGFLVLVFTSTKSWAQSKFDDVTTLDSVEVIAMRRPLSDFPGAIAIVDGPRLRKGQRKVSLSESLVRVPGVSVLDRQNYAHGFNFGLTPAHFVSAEIGARWRHNGIKADVAVYRVNGEDEIVPADSRGGRASFANAGNTSRIGIELGWSGQLGNAWSYALAANWIRARFDESFSYSVFVNGANTIRTAETGNRIPGIPHADAFAELMWQSPDDSFGLALEMRVSDTIAVDDRNSDYADGYARSALRMDWCPSKAHGWNGFVRLDNIFDRQYVGSVIVNEGNSRYFEPGAGRGFTVGIGWSTVPN